MHGMWTHFKLVGAYHQASGSLSFSHLDRRVGGTNLSLIDRWYVDEWASNRGGMVGILDSTILSDHAPLILHMHAAGHLRQSQGLQNLASLIEDESMVERVERI